MIPASKSIFLNVKVHLK